jgi:transposase
MANAPKHKPSGQAPLFERHADGVDAEAIAVPAASAAHLSPAAPRLLYANRQQIELRACDLDALIPTDHPARSVWAFVHALDLAPLYAKVKSVQGLPGAPAIDPAILLALWLWATIDGVGSAREIDRLCEHDDIYRWLCGGVGVNHHTLASFRTGHTDWLDAQLTRSIAALMERKLVTLDVVAQDGLRIRAHAKASSFRRKERLSELHALAQAQVHALKSEIDADSGASTRRKSAARERAAREREERVSRALATFDKLEQGARDKAKDKASSRVRRSQAGKAGEPASPPDPSDEPQARPSPRSQTSPQPEEAEKSSTPDTHTPKRAAPKRVSTSDAEARVMKMADGGFRPAYNAQLAVDEATQLIAGVEVVCEGSDMNEMQPMHDQIAQRYKLTPTHWLADGGYPKYDALEVLSRRGTQPVVPPARSRKPGFDPLSPKADDSMLIARWRAFMASAEGQALYRRRAASIECVNAQLRRRGLSRLNVWGKAKARAVLLWHALAHNLMRMRSLKFAFSG